MTAIVVVAQPKYGLIHIATDAAIYSPEQDVVAFSGKTSTVPHWPGALTNVGSAAAHPLFAGALAQGFSTFDELVSISESDLRDYTTAWDVPIKAEVIVAGISARRGPEAYVFRTAELTASGGRDEVPEYEDAPFRLVKLPDHIMTPCPTDQVMVANYTGIDVSAPPEEVIWSMRKVLEMQRSMILPAGIGAIGGFGSLTTISADGISERILCRWPEDQIGRPLRPPMIDWDQWHRENPRPGRRLRRDIAERKAQKSKLFRLK